MHNSDFFWSNLSCISSIGQYGISSLAHASTTNLTPALQTPCFMPRPFQCPHFRPTPLQYLFLPLFTTLTLHSYPPFLSLTPATPAPYFPFSVLFGSHIYPSLSCLDCPPTNHSTTPSAIPSQLCIPSAALANLSHPPQTNQKVFGARRRHFRSRGEGVPLPEHVTSGLKALIVVGRDLTDARGAETQSEFRQDSTRLLTPTSCLTA